MVRGGRRTPRFRPERIGDFLDAAYCLETDDQMWLTEVMQRARAVSGREGPMHGAIYDASDVSAFRVDLVNFVDFSAKGVDCIMEGLNLFTPEMVTRTFRSLLAGSTSSVALAEMLPMLDALGALGFPDTLNINGLDPGGRGVFLGLWKRERGELPTDELAFYRRMAHHLGAAHRCRRRLRESQGHRSTIDATDGAEAILDGRRRVVHATGPALAKDAREALIGAAKVRDLARTRTRKRKDGDERFRQWRPLTSARWTLVDRFESNGAKYVVARENQSQVRGLASLSDRERQVVAYLAIGQSTKETAYALGISDATVRVLLARAATKLGVRARAALLNHSEVRSMRPQPRTSDAAVSMAGPRESARGQRTPGSR
jgi:DNA-binding CsgD family transcriptional regulator